MLTGPWLHFSIVFYYSFFGFVRLTGFYEILYCAKETASLIYLWEERPRMGMSIHYTLCFVSVEPSQLRKVCLLYHPAQSANVNKVDSSLYPSSL